MSLLIVVSPTSKIFDRTINGPRKAIKNANDTTMTFRIRLISIHNGDYNHSK